MINATNQELLKITSNKTIMQYAIEYTVENSKLKETLAMINHIRFY